MNFAHLKYAVEVEKTGSITQAAENLYMGQPNLSKAMKELESAVGITIFRRTSKGVVPTARGEVFLNYAKGILAQLEEMESMYKPEAKNKISFSMSVPRASYITHAFTRFINGLDKSKEIDINFVETNSMKTISNVVQGDCGMGIIRYQSEYEDYFFNTLADKRLSCEVVWEFEYLALMSRQHPLALKEHLHYSELAKNIELVHGDVTVPYLSVGKTKKRIDEKQIHTKRRIYVYERGSQFDLLTDVAGTYMWVSPVPQELLERYGLVQRRCDAAKYKYKDVLIYPEGMKKNQLHEEFLRQLEQVRAEVSAVTYQ